MIFAAILKAVIYTTKDTKFKKDFKKYFFVFFVLFVVNEAIAGAAQPRSATL